MSGWAVQPVGDAAYHSDWKLGDVCYWTLTMSECKTPLVFLLHVKDSRTLHCEFKAKLEMKLARNTQLSDKIRSSQIRNIMMDKVVHRCEEPSLENAKSYPNPAAKWLYKLKWVGGERKKVQGHSMAPTVAVKGEGRRGGRTTVGRRYIIQYDETHERKAVPPQAHCELVWFCDSSKVDSFELWNWRQQIY